MKVIIDTNVLVSAILKNKIPEWCVEYVCTKKNVQWFVSHEILTEYKMVLRRKKFALPQDILKKWFQVFDVFSHIVDFKQPTYFMRDRKDSQFIACALAVDANFLITGDRDFEDAKKLLNTVILSPSQFKKMFEV